MKNLVTLGLLAFGLALSSCEKCATCTSVETDPFLPPETITEDFCQKPHIYENTLETYERSGWDCEEDQ